MRRIIDSAAITHERIRPLTVSAVLLVLLALIAGPWQSTQAADPVYTCGWTPETAPAYLLHFAGDTIQASKCNDPEGVMITVSDAEVIRVNPSQSGRGLTFGIAPVWGTAGNQTERLWGARDASGLETEREFEAKGRLEAELGYGFGVSRTRGVVTPYAGLSLSEGSSRTWRTGTRWNLAPGAVLGLEGSHASGAEGTEPTRSVTLRTELRW